MTVHNPILPGFYPDPSACSADGKFYLVNSSFSYFPGLPVWESDDLSHWTQTGNAVDRTDQLDYSGAGISRGLFAPCIRYHDGTFYIVCTQVDKLGNFIIHAKDPAGPWSSPVQVCDENGTGADGIDPSLFFDDDGTSWYIGTHEKAGGGKYLGDYEVYIRKIDVSTGTLSGKTYGVWDGALKNCVWPEGPHVYKKDGWYYLLAAEGGTGTDHAVMIARSRSLTEGYTGMPRNPLLTHRHLGPYAEISSTGHADLFDDGNGCWYMVLLATRPYGDEGGYPGERVSNMGRETFLVPVSWADGWPVAAPGSGKIENSFTVQDHPRNTERALPMASCTHFTADSLPPDWLTLRVPLYSLTERRGCLRLYTCGRSLRSTDRVSFAGRRQRSMSYVFRCCMEFTPVNDQDEAGIVLLQSEDFQYRFAVTAGQTGRSVLVIMAAGKEVPETVIAEKQLDTGCTECTLTVFADAQRLSFYAAAVTGRPAAVCTGADARILSTERAGGFVGTVLGVYASGVAPDQERAAHADFFWVELDSV